MIIAHCNKFYTIFLLIAAATAFCRSVPSYAAGPESADTNTPAAAKWEIVSPNDVDLPRLTKAELIAKIHQSLFAHKQFRSWEAKYSVAMRQPAQKSRSIPEVRQTSHVWIISNSSMWRAQLEREYFGGITQHDNYSFICDGNVVTELWPNTKWASTQSPQQFKGLPAYSELPDLLPSLPAPECLPTREISTMLDIVESADSNLSPSYTRVNGHICYVLEYVETKQHPLFKTSAELEAWKKANPEDANRWLHTTYRMGLAYVADFRAKPGDIYKVQVITRLAIDPQQDFAVVRWAQGLNIQSGRFCSSAFPTTEMTYSGFRTIDEGLCIPFKMTYCRYGTDGQLHNSRKMVIEEFAVNKQYSASLFECNIPAGYQVTDSARSIVYRVGDSKEKIEALVAVAKARDAFYDNLRKQQAPALEYSAILNSKQISLADFKGKSVKIHFWSLGCGPCMAQMPQLQQEYASAKRNSDEVFISVHPRCDADDLAQVKKAIQKYAITFPVVIDAPDQTDRLPGKTFKKYGVHSFPTDIVIGEDGRFSEITPKELISDVTDAIWWPKAREK